MSRQAPLRGILAAVTVVVLAGCHPQQPFYFNEDGDLSHYKGMATELEYPDVESDTLADVSGAIRPFSLENSDPKDIWDLTLEEAVRNALANNKVMRSLGATTSFLPGSFSGTQFTAAPGSLTISPDTVSTVYDPALAESNPLTGVEAALSAFDAQFNTSVYWDKIDRPQNTAGFVSDFRPQVAQQDLGTFQAVLSKTAATGGTWYLAHNVRYDKNNSPVAITHYQINLAAPARKVARNYRKASSSEKPFTSSLTPSAKPFRISQEPAPAAQKYKKHSSSPDHLVTVWSL